MDTICKYENIKKKLIFYRINLKQMLKEYGISKEGNKKLKDGTVGTYHEWTREEVEQPYILSKNDIFSDPNLEDLAHSICDLNFSIASDIISNISDKKIYHTYNNEYLTYPINNLIKNFNRLRNLGMLNYDKYTEQYGLQYYLNKDTSSIIDYNKDIILTIKHIKKMKQTLYVRFPEKEEITKHLRKCYIEQKDYSIKMYISKKDILFICSKNKKTKEYYRYCKKHNIEFTSTNNHVPNDNIEFDQFSEMEKQANKQIFLSPDEISKMILDRIHKDKKLEKYYNFVIQKHSISAEKLMNEMLNRYDELKGNEYESEKKFIEFIEYSILKHITPYMV